LIKIVLIQLLFLLASIQIQSNQDLYLLMKLSSLF